MASKKLKKALKALGAGIAIAGLGRAFTNRNARASTDADAIKAMTSDAAYSGSKKMPAVQAPIYQDDIMRGGSGVKNMRNIPGIVVPGKRYSILDSMGFKKGGRVGCGIAKKGFGKAMKKEKK